MARPIRPVTSPPTQDNRIGRLTTNLGKDVLLIVRFDGSEGLSELYEYRIEAISQQSDIDFDPIIGTQCSVTIKTFNGEEREFHGVLVEAQWIGATGQFFRYRLVLRPWLWFLTRTTECRIFQDKTAPDIIKEVFKKRGFEQTTHWESRLSGEGDFPKLEYCVQYRETDFNFVSRMMEKEGIYYYFKHKDGKHVMVLANGIGSHDDIQTMQEIGIGPAGQRPKAKSSEMPFESDADAIVHGNQFIAHWMSERMLRSGVFEFNDYNYEKPGQNMSCIEMGSETYTRSNLEVYDYPGDYRDPDVGRRYVQFALEAEQARDHRRHGSGEAISLFPGGLTTLKNHPSPQQNVKYLVVRATHSFGNQTYRTGSRGTQGDGSYTGEYEVLPSSRPFRAPIRTPKPRIYGVQTAVVVDKKARGRFEKSPEEIEVEKLTEIYVQFYWDRRQHDEKRSCKVRCAQVWSGKKWGGQFIPRIGMEVVVEFMEGDPDRPLIVGSVYNDTNQPPWDLPAKKTISGIMSESTKGDQGNNFWNFEDKKGSEQINIHAQKDLNVTVNNNETRSVGNDMSTTIGHSETRTVGKNFKTPTGKASQKTTVKQGDVELDVESGAILYTAKMKIVLTVGPSKLTIDPTGITLDAPLITIKAGTVCTIQGLPVKIN